MKKIGDFIANILWILYGKLLHLGRDSNGKLNISLKDND